VQVADFRHGQGRTRLRSPAKDFARDIGIWLRQSRFRILAAWEQQIKERSQLSEAVSPLPRRTRTQPLAQDQTQVEGSHVDQLPLQNVLVSAQVRAPHAAGIVAMGEAAFNQLAAPPQ
jgi:hypothetical protein